MPTSKNLFRFTAAVVATGVVLFAPLPTAAQQDDRKAEEPAAAAPEKPAAETPAAGTAATGTPAAGTSAAEAPVHPPRVPPDVPTTPPRNLKKVGDHWTPYDPPDPESFPPDASVHIIVKGETLWGLADLSYNNPYLWPQLWDQNRYILDSHWIYPGDPLLVPPRPLVVSQGTPAEVVPQGQEGAPGTNLEPMPSEEEGEVQEPLTAQTPAPQAQTAPRDNSNGYAGGHVPLMVDQSDIRCSGYIAESGKRSHLFIAENDEPGYDNVTIGTIIYLNRGSKNDERLQPGARFSIVEREGKVQHPVSDRSEGWFIKRLGEIKVLKVMEDTAVAVVTFACDEIRVGNELVELEYQQVPQREAPPFDRLRFERNGKPTGYVIHVQDTVVRVAAGDLAQIDLGKEDGLNPGDFLTAFELITPGKRPHQADYHYKFNGEVFEGADLHYDYFRDEYPAKPVGQMVVVSTGSHTSTVKVIHAISEVHRGTMVEVD